MNRFEFFADRKPWQRGIALHMVQRMPDGATAVATNVTMQTVAPDAGDEARPFMQLRDGEAQQLMDELWRSGYRPSEGSGSAGSLAATERHLDDMRRLVFEQPTPLKAARG